jgi:hypothetical protein
MPLLVIDQTGVGQAVAALFRPADLKARLRPTPITAGHTASLVDGVWQVARQEWSIPQTRFRSKAGGRSGPLPIHFLAQRLPVGDRG